uniref:peptidylprolyl isomerase n=1 Tax=Alexandrium monilatum TaxID=311494 RepID=A0A7S4W4D9_9DINO
MPEEAEEEGVPADGPPDGPASAAPAPPPTDPAERLKLAEGLREEGNAKFKAQETDAARKDYEKALTLLRLGGDGVSQDLQERAKALRVPVMLNLALCCLRVEPCEACRALELCEEVLDEEPENAKAMYRKAKALIELGELKEAEWELVRACKFMPKDPAPRRDLEQLRKRVRDSLARERATYEGLFERGPGFASDNREQSAAAGASKLSQRDLNDIYFHDEKENPYEASERPHEEARELQAAGRLSDAVNAWEAALSQSAARAEWPAHFGYCLEFGRLFMDLNMDRLALRCFNKVLEPPETAGDASEQSPDPAASAATRRHALLLRAVCLLNEAEGDPQVEVSECLGTWLRHVWDAAPAGGGKEPLEEQLTRWREAEGAAAGADSAVALGLLDLLGGKASAVQRFADALRAPEDEGSCFGAAERRAVKWNMLGAVLANRKRYEDALLAYAEALGLQPKYPRALINRGHSFSGKGQLPEAAAAYAEALALSPSWSAEAMWPLLAKAAEDQTAVDELAEAAKGKNLTRVRELLKPWTAMPDAPKEPIADVLARLDLS